MAATCQGILLTYLANEEIELRDFLDYSQKLIVLSGADVEMSNDEQHINCS